MVMVVNWNLLDIKKVLEWTLMFQKARGQRLQPSMIFFFSTQDTGKLFIISL